MPRSAIWRTVTTKASCLTRPFPPPFRPLWRRGGTPIGQRFVAFTGCRSPRSARTPHLLRPPGTSPERSPSRLLFFPLLRERGGTGGTVLESVGKAGALAYPLGGTGWGNGRNGRWRHDVWAPPPAVVTAGPTRAGTRSLPPGPELFLFEAQAECRRCVHFHDFLRQRRSPGYSGGNDWPPIADLRQSICNRALYLLGDSRCIAPSSGGRGA